MCSNSGNVYAEENAFEDILYFMKSNRVEMELDEFGWMFLIAASIREIDYHRRSCYKDNTYWKMRKDYAWIDRFGKVYDPFLTSMSWEFMYLLCPLNFCHFSFSLKGTIIKSKFHDLSVPIWLWIPIERNQYTHWLLTVLKRTACIQYNTISETMFGMRGKSNDWFAIERLSCNTPQCADNWNWITCIS